jgi:subtilisin family serine protease
VLSNSWGGGLYSSALQDEIEKAGANDILFVAAAGNYNWNNDSAPMYPCGYETANEICVAATTKSDDRASFSNYGPNSVDLGAPGVDILSTVPGGGYASYSGTSMATPHVAGAAALILSTGYQSVFALKTTILNSVDHLTSLQGVVRTGGRLDVCNALPACSGAAPLPAGFSMSVTPDRQTVLPGATAIYTVTLKAVGGFTGPVDFSIGGLPTDVNATFTPNQVTLPGSTTAVLIVTPSISAVPGQYTLNATGAGGGYTSSATARLQVKRN